MNTIKRTLALALVFVMMLTLMSACGNKAELLAAKQQELCSGKWLSDVADSREEALALAECIDLYQEEIALVDLDSLKYSVILEYHMDGTFRQYISPEHTKAHVRAFYEGIFAGFYAARDTLGALYDVDLSAATEEEFRLFYADLYGFEDFNALMDEFAESAYDYQWEDLESGTYSMKTETSIYIKRETSDPDLEASGMLSFQLENGTLTLDYSDGPATYTNIG